MNYLPQTPTKSKRKFCNFFSSYASPKLNKKDSPKDFYVLEAVILMLKQKTTPGTAGGKKDFSKAKTGELKASPKGLEEN